MSDPQSPDAKADGPGPVPDAGDRLVLTSALRVPADPMVPAPSQVAVSPEPDTEAIRTMVRAILREELAGPLGDRITRGVRKLTRTEVATLLAARDPD